MESELQKINEGKTKEIFAVAGDEETVFIKSKDTLTAFNGARKDYIEGKGDIANQTACNVFAYLNLLGFKTHFISYQERPEGRGFLASRCKMIPLEWVARRVATGSYLKRFPGTTEGFRFSPPLIEVFFKDDERNDPQWSFEQVVAHGFSFNDRKIEEREVAIMFKTTEFVFRALEKAWAREKCSLIDMKIEFGVTSNGQIVVADVIDNDSWRIWPSGDASLQLDKQFYRNLSLVDEPALLTVKQNYEQVLHFTKGLASDCCGKIAVVMGSKADMKFANTICDFVASYGITVSKRIASAHKTTAAVLKIVADFESEGVPIIFVAVAGRSNGLGPVIAGNTVHPVINAPPCDSEWLAQDIWSSLRMPSGLGCSTVLGAKEAALAAVKILANHDHVVYGRLLASQCNSFMTTLEADASAASDIVVYEKKPKPSVINSY